MIVVSDTNILCSFAAADALSLLQQLFVRSTLSIPPAVHDEIQVAVVSGRSYLAPVTLAITEGDIAILELTEEEQALATTYPRKLNAGEREVIALCQQRRIPLLSNDRQAVRFSQTNGIDAVDLPILLRRLWTRHLISQPQVEEMISRMEQVERLTLTPEHRAAIFAPQRQRQ